MKTTLLLLALVAVAASAVIPEKLSSINCLMCEIAVKAAENPADREAHTVEKAFDAECKAVLKIPFVEHKCEAYANSKIDPIIKELEGGTAPEDVCTALKEC